MNTIENIVTVGLIAIVFVAFIIISSRYIRKYEEKYWKELENKFLDKKKE